MGEEDRLLGTTYGGVCFFLGEHPGGFGLYGIYQTG